LLHTTRYATILLLHTTRYATILLLFVFVFVFVFFSFTTGILYQHVKIVYH